MMIIEKKSKGSRVRKRHLEKRDRPQECKRKGSNGEEEVKIKREKKDNDIQCEAASTWANITQHTLGDAYFENKCSRRKKGKV